MHTYLYFFFFFFNDTATTEIYTLSLHDALPISHYGADCPAAVVVRASWPDERIVMATLGTLLSEVANDPPERTALILVGRSEEHTSELQSHLNLVCRLLLEKKKKKPQHHMIHYT